MVLDIAGGLFEQKDVRETNAGGITESNFNTDDFSIASGVVSLKSKTSYYSINPAEWNHYQSTKDVSRTSAYCKPNEDAVVFHAAVHLPHGAVVTGIIVYGDAAATAESYTLYRTNKDDQNGDTLAQANIGTADATISNATIDNSNYTYVLSTSTLDTDDKIYGAVITYTTDYI